jgi:hypothetical protein
VRAGAGAGEGGSGTAAASASLRAARAERPDMGMRAVWGRELTVGESRKGIEILAQLGLLSVAFLSLDLHHRSCPSYHPSRASPNMVKLTPDVRTDSRSLRSHLVELDEETRSSRSLPSFLRVSVL